MQPSPYTPGEVARAVPGRAVQLAETDERLAYMIDLQRIVGRIRVDIASRGIGKTSLLRQIQLRAEHRGALTVWVTASRQPGLIAALSTAIDRRTSSWRSEARQRVRDALARVTMTVGVPGVAQVTATGSPNTDGDRIADVREFEDLLRRTLAAAVEEGHRGLVLFIDEVQAADDDGLRTLTYAWQHFQSEGADLPIAVFAAGLPTTPETIAAVVTFSERFAYRPMDLLHDDAAALALGEPATALGVSWDRGALDDAVAAAGGYPYSVQLIGDGAWAAAGRPDPGGRISASHVDAGIAAAQRDLEALFRARWAIATPAERSFLTAMAGIGTVTVSRGDVARRLGRASRDIGTTRARLLDKGLIEVAGHGLLSFGIPGFADWVRGRT